MAVRLLTDDLLTVDAEEFYHEVECAKEVVERIDLYEILEAQDLSLLTKILPLMAAIDAVEMDRYLRCVLQNSLANAKEAVGPEKSTLVEISYVLSSAQMQVACIISRAEPQPDRKTIIADINRNVVALVEAYGESPYDHIYISDMSLTGFRNSIVEGPSV
jgi:hypothetical protein